MPSDTSFAPPAAGQRQPARVGFFDLAARRLAWLDRRQTVLSENVANASVPGYRPRDVRPFSAPRDGFAGVLARTDARHLHGRHDAEAEAVQIDGMQDLSGNGVELDSELTKLAQNGTDQLLTTSVMTAYLGLYRTVLGR